MTGKRSAEHLIAGVLGVIVKGFEEFIDILRSKLTKLKRK